MADCQLCGRPQRDVAYVCSRCAGDVVLLLVGDDKRPGAADLWPELDTTITRQARMGEPGPRPRGRAPNQPIRPGLGNPADDQQWGDPAGLPVDLRASRVAEDVRNEVTTWARLVAEERGGQPPTDVPETMRWLAEQVEWIRHQRWADEALRGLELVREVARVVDRPGLRSRVPIGPCPEVACSGQIIATVPAREDQAAVARCDGCGTEWPTWQWARLGRRMLHARAAA